MNENLFPTIILGVVIASLWLSTTIIFVRMVRQNNKIGESAKTIWSIIIVVYWIYGVIAYLIWKAIWQASDKTPHKIKI
jgi:hypothetical protein